MADWYCDGNPVEHIPVDDRGFQYGDGLFETIAIRGGEARLWPLHLDRLQQGCTVLNIEKPSYEELAEGLSHAVFSSAGSSTRRIVKLVVTAGSGERGYRRTTAKPAIFFGVFEAATAPRSMYRDGVESVLCATRLAAGSPTAGLKTLGRTEQVLARSEIKTFEGFMMDADDHLICGTMSNVFFVRGKSIATPSVDRCGVAGVMRQHVMSCLGADGHDVTVQEVQRADLAQFDEVFISNSQIGVVPVAACEDQRWGVGDVTRRVMATMADNGIEECRV